MKKNNRVEVYDTTLRDGAQGMGVSFSLAGRLRFARRMDDLGVHYIEGGYPGAGGVDAEFFREAAGLRLRNAVIAAFGSTRKPRCSAAQDANLKALIESGAPVATIFGKSWRLHVRDVLRTDARENLAMIRDSVCFLRQNGLRVIFDAEHFYDGWKDSSGFALDAIRVAADAGCEMVVLCDTNGGCLPHEVFAITSEVARAVSVPVGVHCHNDSGMAAANTVEAVRAGARHVQGTINGYGERCGNADLCTVVPTLELKMGMVCIGRAHLAEMQEVSAFVEELANLRHNERLPYVGRSAFAHKAGMHVDAVRKNPRTFEHVNPAAVGNKREVLLSNASGKSSVLLKAIEVGVLGLKKSSAELRTVVAALKEMERNGYAFEAADASFRILVQKILKKHKPFFDLEGFRVVVEKRGKNEPCVSEATIKVKVADKVEHTVGEGDGPVDALDHALRNALIRFYPSIAKVMLTDFQVRILDPAEAAAAKTRVLIESSDGKSVWGTVGVSPNIIEASWEALLDSVEYKLFKDEEERSARSRGRRRGQ